MKTKILYVIENTLFGGGERAFSQIINGLDKEKYKIYVACLPNGTFTQKIKANAEILFLDLSKRFNFINIWRIVKIIKEKNIQIVHSQGGRADFYARLSAKIAKVPVMVSTIAAPIEEYNVNPMKKAVYVALDRFSERFVDKFIVVAEHLGRKLIQIHKISPHKVVKIHNGVDIRKYNYNSQIAVLVRKELNIGPEVLLVGAIGRLTWEKGLLYFIEAVKKIIDSEWQIADKVKYLIVGEGKLRKSLRLKVKRLKLEEKVIFTGFRKDVREILGAIDLLVLSSLREGFPMITLEAMAMGKPIVATNIEGVSESMVDGINGILVPPKDPGALAKAIVCLLEDRKKAQEMGQMGRKVVDEKFNLKDKVEQHERLYQSF